MDFDSIDGIANAINGKQPLNSRAMFRQAVRCVHDPKKHGKLEEFLSAFETHRNNGVYELQTQHRSHNPAWLESWYTDDNPALHRIAEVYAGSGNPALLNTLTSIYQSFIRYLVVQTLRKKDVYFSRLDLEDYYQLGFTGFIEALQKYDRRKGTSVVNQTWERISGSVLDSLRGNCIPRGQRAKVRKYREVTSVPEHEKLKPSEIAEKVGVPVDKLDDIRNLANTDQSRSTVYNMKHGFYSLPTKIGHESIIDAVAKRERVEALKKALMRLPPREAKVIRLYYFSDMSQQQISNSGYVGMANESRVGHLRARAIKRLKIMAAEGLIPENI